MKFFLFRNLALAIVLASCIHSPLTADWPRFRGPNGTGIADGTAPTEWSETQNLKWKVALPGPGVSSPIIVGNKVFVTCYSGYGVARDDVGEMKDLTRHLLCFDANSGDLLWKKDIPNTIEEDPYSGMGIPAHGYASHTPASDGETVFAFFGKTGVIAFDLEGNEKWRKSLGTDSDPRRWGSSSSPIVLDNTLVVTAGPETRAIVGLDKATGEELWRSDSDYFGEVWGTPAIVQVGSEKEIVIGAPYEIWSLNPENGKLKWYCEAIESDSFNTSVVVDEDRIYAIEGRRGGGGVAVKAGGKDDITESAVLWKGRQQGGFASPVVYQGRLYHFSNGQIGCYDAKTGEEIFRGRLQDEEANQGGDAGRGRGRSGFGGGGDYPSPVVADGKIYYVNASGTTFVFEAGTELKQLATNRVTSDAESFGGTPAIDSGRIFLRSNKHLYCISE